MKLDILRKEADLVKAYTKKIPLENEFIRAIINGIENADYLYREHMKVENFPTHNGDDGQKWNYINKAINETLPVDRFQIEVMQRGIWQFIGIYDKITGYLYTLMRQKNLSTLRKNADTKLFHYTNALSKLNSYLAGDFAIANEQMSLFPKALYDEAGEEELERILASLIKKIDNEIKCYVLVAFDISQGQVTSIKGIVPSIGMMYFKEENWNEALSPVYDIEENITETEVAEDVILLEHKPRLRRKEKKNDKKEKE